MRMHCEMYGHAKTKKRYIMYMAYHSNTPIANATEDTRKHKSKLTSYLWLLPFCSSSSQLRQSWNESNDEELLLLVVL